MSAVALSRSHARTRSVIPQVGLEEVLPVVNLRRERLTEPCRVIQKLLAEHAFVDIAGELVDGDDALLNPRLIVLAGNVFFAPSTWP